MCAVAHAPPLLIGRPPGRDRRPSPPLYLDMPAGVDPAERLRQFVRLVYGIYGQQGDSLTILLDHRGDPKIGPQVTMMRESRREHLENRAGVHRMVR
jgi:hypothetical protein